MKNDNSTAVLTRLFKELAIPVTKTSIYKELLTHPDSNTFLAFSEVMNNWKVTNVASRVPFEQLGDLKTPFITLLTDKNFVIVTEFEDSRIVISNQMWKNKVFKPDDFKNLYSGSVFLAKAEKESGEPNYVSKRNKEIIDEWRTPIAWSLCVAISLGFLVVINSTFFLILHGPSLY